MAELPLNSLRIENFRGIKELEIDRLAQINLLVGKNSVGKTTVLDAIRLYASGADPAVPMEILQERHEMLAQYDTTKHGELSSDSVQTFIDDWSALFYQIPKVSPLESPLKFFIGEKSKEKNLEIELSWRNIRELQANIGKFYAPDLPPEELALSLTLTNHLEQKIYPLEYLLLRSSTVRLRTPIKSVVPHLYIPTTGLNLEQLAELWNEIALTDLEQDIIQTLRLIKPEIEQINLIEKSRRLARFPFVKTNSSRIPLTRLGEGVTRLFGLALAIVNAKDGILLIDEIESGLHHSIQLHLWEILLKLAYRLNVQIFATTHSDDIVENLEFIAQKSSSPTIQIIQLQKWQEFITPNILNTEKMKLALNENIEVR